MVNFLVSSFTTVAAPFVAATTNQALNANFFMTAWGDSLTYGAPRPPNTAVESYPAYISNMLTRPIVNHGISGLLAQT